MENKRVTASVPPYFRDAASVRRFMLFGVASLLPVAFLSLSYFGLDALGLIAVSFAAGIAVDGVFAFFRKKRISPPVILTCLVYALTLPPDLPLWMAAAGIAVGVLAGFELFGGTGKNIVNPALLGRCLLQVVFPVAFVAGHPPSGLDYFLGGHCFGSLGELCGVFLVAGVLFLIASRVASWGIVVAALLGGWGFSVLCPSPYAAFPTGGFLFGVFFLATDSTTAPITKMARAIYGLSIGSLALFLNIRFQLNTGILFSILAMNLAAPLLDRAVYFLFYRRHFKKIAAAVMAGLLFAAPSVKAETGPLDPIKEAQPFYNWLAANSDAVTGLPTSHVGDPRFREWCTTYDAAVCAMAFLAAGDVPRAKRIVDFYMNKDSVRRLGGVVEAVLNFSKEGKGVEWQVRTGSNMWLGLAAYHIYLATGEQEYLEFAKRQADFALALQDVNPKSPTYGGIPLGPKGVPYNPKDQHISWDETKPEFVDVYSTEANIDAWALMNMLYSTTKEPRYLRGRDLLMQWLKKVAFNAPERRFNRGFYLKPDLTVAPDTHFWAISALGPARLDEFEPGLADRLLAFMAETSEVTVYYNLQNGKLLPVKGYDFIDRANPVVKERGALVSPEWTLQAVLAYALLAETSADPQKQARYREHGADLLSGILLMADRNADKAALPYATKGGVAIGHEYNTPAEDNRSAIGAAWAILALLDYDPLNLEKLQRRYRKP